MPDPITPPQELRDKWLIEAPNTSVYDYLIDSAAQWGADQELEACCEIMQEWPSVVVEDGYALAHELIRDARRPQPPSLKEDALAALHGIDDQGPTPEQVVTIRRALEALPND